MSETAIPKPLKPAKQRQNEQGAKTARAVKAESRGDFASLPAAANSELWRT